jgi:hypothetical protein
MFRRSIAMSLKQFSVRSKTSGSQAAQIRGAAEADLTGLLETARWGRVVLKIVKNFALIRNRSGNFSVDRLMERRFQSLSLGAKMSSEEPLQEPTANDAYGGTYAK